MFRLPNSEATNLCGHTMIGVVFDRSGSTAERMGSSTRFRKIVEAVSSFVVTISQHRPDTLIWVGSFGSEFRLVAGPLQALHSEEICRKVRSIRINCSTNFYDALKSASELFQTGSGVSRKFLIFLSDGHNTERSPINLARELKASGVEIHTIGVADSTREVDEKLLKEIASFAEDNKTKHYRFIKDGHILVQHFVEIAHGIVIS